MSNKILIIAGDPNSINSEIIYKSWKKLKKAERKKIVIIGSCDLLNKQFKKLKIKISLNKVRHINDIFSSKFLNIINIPINFDNPFKIKKKESESYLIKSLNLAHDLGHKKIIKGFINCPVDKSLIRNSKKVGLTEYFAMKSKVPLNTEVMMIHNKNLSVVPITTHINIKKVSSKINANLIIKKIKTLNICYKKIFKLKPKIGVLGLNPHNGELIKGSEEKKFIIPAIKKLKKQKINVEGPFVSDTIFINNYKYFNVIVGMYHDQVLGPFKTLFKFDAINITLGLKYLRISPDHGPAVDLLKKNKANPSSLLKCINFINNLNK